MPGYFFALELLHHFSPLLLEVGCMLELKGFVDDIVFGVVEKLEHLELVLEHLVAQVVLWVGLEIVPDLAGAHFQSY